MADSIFMSFSVYSFPFLKPTADPQTQQEEGPVHLPAVRCQHRPADHDQDLTKFSSGLHQQLPLQLGSKQLLRASFSRRAQVCCHLCIKLRSKMVFKETHFIVPTCVFLFPPLDSPSFSFPHHINPVAYQQLLSQQRGLNAFGHTPPLIQPSPSSFSARQHPLSAPMSTSHNSSNSEVNQVHFSQVLFVETRSIR